MPYAKYRQLDLRTARLRAGLTQRQLARLLRVSEFQIYRFERGIRRPDLKSALKLGLLYEVKVDALFPDVTREASRELRVALKQNGHAHPMVAIPTTPRPQRILALDPWSRGIGVAVLYGEKLVLCRVRHLRGPPLPERLLKNGITAVEDLIQIYAPGVLVLPSVSQSNSHRSRHVRVFVQTVTRLAARRRIRVMERSRQQIELTLGVEGSVSRHRVAEVVAYRFPVLQPKLPPPRRPWQPQDLRLSAFFAVALTLTANRKRTAPNVNQAAERRE